MVENTRKKTNFSRIRPINLPVPIEVEKHDDGILDVIIMHGEKAKISGVEDMWEIADEWWRTKSVARRYYRLSITGDRSITIFCDLINGRWYQQRP